MAKGTGMIKAILFDLFGTLIGYGDQEAGMRLSRNGLFAAFVQEGGPAFKEQFDADWENRLFAPLGPDEDMAATPFLSKIGRLFRWYGLEPDPQAVERAAVACLASWDGSFYLPKDTLPALHALGGKYALALVSNFDHPPYARGVLARTGLAGHLNPIIISGEVAVDKPDPRIFRLALEVLGCAPEETIFVGDSLDADIAGSSAVGCRPVLIDREGKHPAYTGERIEHLLQLPALLGEAGVYGVLSRT